MGNLENTLCAIDATPARRIGGAKGQYKTVNILRELTKSYAGFSLAQSMFEEGSTEISFEAAQQRLSPTEETCSADIESKASPEMCYEG